MVLPPSGTARRDIVGGGAFDDEPIALAAPGSVFVPAPTEARASTSGSRKRPINDSAKVPVRSGPVDLVDSKAPMPTAAVTAGALDATTAQMREIEEEPPVERPPVLQLWAAGAAEAAADRDDDHEVVTRTFNKNPRPFSRDSSGLDDGDSAANKRFRGATPFSSGSHFQLFSTESLEPTDLRKAEQLTKEEAFAAAKATSDQMLEGMSLSQQNTQECTQTLEESPTMTVKRLVLHPEVDRALTAYQKTDLEKNGLYRIELHRLNPRVSLGRDNFMHIFDRKLSGIDPLRLSRTHCVIECVTDPHSSQLKVFITDRSTNGIRIDGATVVKNQKIELKDQQTITLLSSRQGSVLLGYVVEDPYVRGAYSGLRPLSASYGGYGRSQDGSQQPREAQEHTLGVLFAAPLVGKDIHGTYHPIAELDIKREYSILRQSLVEASRYARRPVEENENGVLTKSTTLFQYPHQINVCAKFANTENFRMMITVGYRALHFSGHGDERHLYFEDGMGLVHPIPHSSLQELFSAGDGGDSLLRLVFVSACSSAPLAHAFVQCGIPHVIGVKTNQKIEDFAAIEFTRSFYLALATGKSVGASFTIAQQAVAKSPNIRGPMEVAEKFLLLPEGGDHSEVIFPLVTMEAHTAAELGPLKLRNYPKLWFDDLPSLCQGFCNRSVEVYKVCLALMLTQTRITRLVTICGEEGIGKTAVAHAVAQYVGPRITSEGGVKFFSVAKLVKEQSAENIRQARMLPSSKLATLTGEVLPHLERAVREHLDQHKARLELKSHQLLFVFDGCDYFLRSDARRELFRSFLSDLLTNNALLKIVLTACSSFSADGAVAGHGERVYALSRFNSKMSAKMLLSLMSRPIRMEEIQKARLLGTTNDRLELIASHPALQATLGIPKRIADLAGKLNEVLMDEVQVSDAEMAMMD